MTEVASGAFVAVAPSDAIPDEFAAAYYLGDQKLRICLARVDDQVYAFDDLCTCADQPCPLSGGMLVRTTIRCQCHGSEFDITTGLVRNGPASEPLQVYDVREVSGVIQVRA